MPSSELSIQAERRILLLREQGVMLDFELAELHEVETRALKQTVRRNLVRFPADFMFELSTIKIDGFVSQGAELQSAFWRSEPVDHSRRPRSSPKIRKVTRIPLFASVIGSMLFLASCSCAIHEQSFSISNAKTDTVQKAARTSGFIDLPTTDNLNRFRKGNISLHHNRNSNILTTHSSLCFFVSHSQIQNWQAACDESERNLQQSFLKLGSPLKKILIAAN